jgi:hypothetical protein
MSAPLSNVQLEPAEFEWRVDGLPRASDSLPGGSAGRKHQDHTAEVLAFTQEIFPGKVTLVETDDPEIPDHRYLLLQVSAHGSLEQLAAQNDEWHRRLCQLPGRIPGRYRLSILPE